MPRSRTSSGSDADQRRPKQLALPLDGAGLDAPAPLPLERIFDGSAPGLTFGRAPAPPDFDAERFARSAAAQLGVTPRQRKANAAIRDATRAVLTRPYCKQWAYLDPDAGGAAATWRHIFPNPLSEFENRVLWLKPYADAPLLALMADRITGTIPPGSTPAFPFYRYDVTGREREETISDDALRRFRGVYGDDGIGKWDVFYYIYGLLHHPRYRAHAADGAALPDIAYAPDFWPFADAGFRLAELHLYYDAPHIVAPYPLEARWTGRKRDWRTGQMSLIQPDSLSPLALRERGLGGEGQTGDTARPHEAYTALAVNDRLTLTGIPPEASDYRLGNRSALEWVVDQYRVKTDKRTGITTDPNTPDDPQALVQRVAQVVAVSVETVRIAAALPPFS